MPGAGGLRQRVLRVAAAGSVAARAAGRRVVGADRGDTPRFAGHVRRAADSRGAAGGGRAAWPQAGGAADAGERPARRRSAQMDEDDGGGRVGGAGAGPGAARLFGFGGGRAVGGGRDLRSDAGGVSVPGGGRGCVFQARRGLVHGRRTGDAADARRAGHGAGAARRARRDPPLRPGLAIHLAGVRQPLPRRRRAAVDGLDGRLLRQRAVREFFSPRWSAN